MEAMLSMHSCRRIMFFPSILIFRGKLPRQYRKLILLRGGLFFECLQLKPEDTLLVRGGTCALGYAAIQLAKVLGCKVISTTHRDEKLPLLAEAGADECQTDGGTLTGKISGVSKALDLIGPRYLKDTLAAVDKGAIVCCTGILGGIYDLNHFDPIKDIPNGVYLTGFFSNYPTQEIMDDIFGILTTYKLTPCFGKVFDFTNIRPPPHTSSPYHGAVFGSAVCQK